MLAEALLDSTGTAASAAVAPQSSNALQPPQMPLLLPKLTQLDLSRNAFGDEGATAISAMLLRWAVASAATATAAAAAWPAPRTQPWSIYLCDTVYLMFVFIEDLVDGCIPYELC